MTSLKFVAALAAAGLFASGMVFAEGAKPNDAQIAHIAYTAGQLDIAAAESSQACSSASVMSGSAATRARRASSRGASFGFGPRPDRRAVTSPVFRRRIKAL
jgi:hypothetical protein